MAPVTALSWPLSRLLSRPQSQPCRDPSHGPSHSSGHSPSHSPSPNLSRGPCHDPCHGPSRPLPQPCHGSVTALSQPLWLPGPGPGPRPADLQRWLSRGQTPSPGNSMASAMSFVSNSAIRAAGVPSPRPPGTDGDRGAYRPGGLLQEAGAVPVSVVVGQVGCRAPIFVPQGGVHVVGDQRLAALQGGGTRATAGLPTCAHSAHQVRRREGAVPAPPHRWETEAADSRGTCPRPRRHSLQGQGLNPRAPPGSSTPLSRTETEAPAVRNWPRAQPVSRRYGQHGGSALPS